MDEKENQKRGIIHLILFICKTCYGIVKSISPVLVLILFMGITNVNKLDGWIFGVLGILATIGVFVNMINEIICGK